MSEGYVVAVKPSARRTSVEAGSWVASEGPHRRFDSKAAAREWAREATPDGRTLWVQDAHPLDEGPADGYLLARANHSRRTDSDRPGEQAALDDV